MKKKGLFLENGVFKHFFSRLFPHHQKNIHLMFIVGVLDIILGVIFLGLGVLGWMLPIMPGTLFFISGVLLISPRHGRILVVWIEKLIHFIKNFFRKK